MFEALLRIKRLPRVIDFGAITMAQNSLAEQKTPARM
jgi:hypothetical protein